MTFEDLRRALAFRARDDFPFEALDPRFVPDGGFAHGAVLVPLAEKDGGMEVLLTRRHAHLRRHAGQICFPGGRIEDIDADSLAGALREAQEEVGLDPAQVDVLGRLDETLVLRSGFRLTPWVGRVPYPYLYAAHPGEVEEILFVPLSALAAPGVHRTESYEAYGMPHEVHFFTVEGQVIWGATARILHKLLAVVAS